MIFCDWAVIVLILVCCVTLGWILWLDYQLEQWRGYAKRVEREAEIQKRV